MLRLLLVVRLAVRQNRLNPPNSRFSGCFHLGADHMAYLCYIDEAGDSQCLPCASTDIQPLLTIAGLIVSEHAVAGLTHDFLALKRKFFPKLFTSSHLLDDVREEVKGNEVRKLIRKSGSGASAQLKFLDSTLSLLEHYDCKLLSTIWVKGIAKPFDSTAVYTRSVQQACEMFQRFLDQKDQFGFMIADFRTTQLNDKVAHSIFTQKYRAKGDPFNRILELPTFGVSNNHVGLQITDLLCSALLFPMASSVYCYGHVSGVHVNPRDLFIRQRFTKRLRKLQFKIEQHSVRVFNPLSDLQSAALFADPPRPAQAASKSAASAEPQPIVVSVSKPNTKVDKRNTGSRPARSTAFGDKLAQAMRKAPSASPATSAQSTLQADNDASISVSLIVAPKNN